MAARGGKTGLFWLALLLACSLGEPLSDEREEVDDDF